MAVLKLIVALPVVDLNKSCGKDKWTALHCATFGGSIYAFGVVKLLLSAGADPNVEDIDGCRPVDVIVAPPKLPTARAALVDLLLNNISDGSVGVCNNGVSICISNASSPILSSNQESTSPSSPSNYGSTPTTLKSSDPPANLVSEKKHYPVDPSLPDGIVYMQLMSFACSNSRSGLVREPIPMIGPSALLSTLEKMLAEGILGSSITVVFLVLIFGTVPVVQETCVSMHMVNLNAGCTLLSNE